MTVNEWLALDDKLGVELAKVLDKDTRRHEVYPGAVLCHRCMKPVIKHMANCDEVILPEYNQPCSVPDPIDINDWNVAKHYEALALDKDPARYATCLRSLYLGGRPVSVWEIIALDRDPRKRLIAAAMAEREEE